MADEPTANAIELTSEQQSSINDDIANRLTLRMAALQAVIAHRNLGISVDINPRTKVRYSHVEEQRARELGRRETREAAKKREAEQALRARLATMGISTSYDDAAQPSDNSLNVEGTESAPTRLPTRKPARILSTIGESRSSDGGSEHEQQSASGAGSKLPVEKVPSKPPKPQAAPNAPNDKEGTLKSGQQSSRKIVVVSAADKGPTGLLAHKALYVGGHHSHAHVAAGDHTAMQIHGRGSGTKAHEVVGVGVLQADSRLKKQQSTYDFGSAMDELAEEGKMKGADRTKRSLFALARADSNFKSAVGFASAPTLNLSGGRNGGPAGLSSPMGETMTSSAFAMLSPGAASAELQRMNERRDKKKFLLERQQSGTLSGAAAGDAKAVQALFVPGGRTWEQERKARGKILEAKLRHIQSEHVNKFTESVAFDPLRSSVAMATASGNGNNGGGHDGGGGSPTSSPAPHLTRQTSASAAAQQQATAKAFNDRSFPELHIHLPKIMRWVACRIAITYDPRKFAYYFLSPVGQDVVADCFWLMHTRLFAEKTRQREARKDAKRRLAELLGHGGSGGGARGGSSARVTTTASLLGGIEEEHEEEEEATIGVTSALAPSDETLLASEVLVESLSMQYYMLLKAVRTNKYLFAQFFPFAVADAVYHTFVFLLPGSKNSYTSLFRLSVFTEVCRLLTGVELAPITVSRMADQLFPDELPSLKVGSQIAAEQKNEENMQGLKSSSPDAGSSNGRKGKKAASNTNKSGGGGDGHSDDEEDEGGDDANDLRAVGGKRSQAWARAMGFRSAFDLFKSTTAADRAYLGIDSTARIEILRKLDRTTILPTSAFLITGASVPPATVTASGSVTELITPAPAVHGRMYGHGLGPVAATVSNPGQLERYTQALQQQHQSQSMNGGLDGDQSTDGSVHAVYRPFQSRSSDAGAASGSPPRDASQPSASFSSSSASPTRMPVLASTRMQAFLMHPVAWESAAQLLPGVAGNPTRHGANKPSSYDVDVNAEARAKMIAAARENMEKAANAVTSDGPGGGGDELGGEHDAVGLDEGADGPDAHDYGGGSKPSTAHTRAAVAPADGSRRGSSFSLAARRPSAALSSAHSRVTGASDDDGLETAHGGRRSSGVGSKPSTASYGMGGKTTAQVHHRLMERAGTFSRLSGVNLVAPDGSAITAPGDDASRPALPPVIASPLKNLHAQRHSISATAAVSTLLSSAAVHQQAGSTHLHAHHTRHGKDVAFNALSLAKQRVHLREQVHLAEHKAVQAGLNPLVAAQQAAAAELQHQQEEHDQRLDRESSRLHSRVASPEQTSRAASAAQTHPRHNHHHQPSLFSPMRVLQGRNSLTSPLGHSSGGFTPTHADEHHHHDAQHHHHNRHHQHDASRGAAPTAGMTHGSMSAPELLNQLGFTTAEQTELAAIAAAEAAFDFEVAEAEDHVAALALDDNGMASVAQATNLPAVGAELAYRMLVARSKRRPLLVPFVTTSTSTLLQRALPHAKAYNAGGPRAMHRTVPVPWAKTGGVETFRSFHGQQAASAASAARRAAGSEDGTPPNTSPSKDVSATHAQINAAIAHVTAENARARAAAVAELRKQKEEILAGGRARVARAAQDIRTQRARKQVARLAEMEKARHQRLLKSESAALNAASGLAGSPESSEKKESISSIIGGGPDIEIDRSDPGMHGAALVMIPNSELASVQPVFGSASAGNSGTASGAADRQAGSPAAGAADGSSGATAGDKSCGPGSSAAPSEVTRYTATRTLQLNLVSLATFARGSGNYDGDPLVFGSPHRKKDQNIAAAAAVAAAAASSKGIQSQHLPGAALGLRGVQPGIHGLGTAIEPVPKTQLKGVAGLLTPLGGPVPGSSIVMSGSPRPAGGATARSA